MSKHRAPRQSPRTIGLEWAAKDQRRLVAATCGEYWRDVPPRPGTGRHRADTEPVDLTRLHGHYGEPATEETDR